MRRIVCLGDSLTSGHGIGTSLAYPAILHQRVRRAGFPYEVINAGVSRETSAHARARLDRALEGDVRVLVLALGANDGLRGVPVPTLSANVSHIIDEAQKRGIAVLLCGMEALPIHGWAYTTAFHQAYVDLAARYKIPLIPFILLNIIGNPRLMQADRAHPNADGARAIADTIWPYLERVLSSPADLARSQGTA
jgi:acyl-CoA thioesterase-1